MNALIFDVETNGKAKNFKAPMSDLANWPRVTQLAWQKIDIETGEVLNQHQSLIYPDGWTVPEEEFFINNNMSTQRCMDEGSPIYKELEILIEEIIDSDVLVAHNADFDVNVVGAEMMRLEMSTGKVIKKICTMKTTTDFCKLPGGFKGQYKWPKLEELYRILFGEDFDGAHDAMADVTATGKCFVELIKRNVIKL